MHSCAYRRPGSTPAIGMSGDAATLILPLLLLSVALGRGVQLGRGGWALAGAAAGQQHFAVWQQEGVATCCFLRRLWRLATRCSSRGGRPRFAAGRPGRPGRCRLAGAWWQRPGSFPMWRPAAAGHCHRRRPIGGVRPGRRPPRARRPSAAASPGGLGGDVPAKRGCQRCRQPPCGQLSAPDLGEQVSRRPDAGQGPWPGTARPGAGPRPAPESVSGRLWTTR